MTHEERLDAFDQLRAKHLRFLTAVLWKLTRDREIFAEAMQYALLDLWRHLEKLGGDKARSYLPPDRPERELQGVAQQGGPGRRSGRTS